MSTEDKEKNLYPDLLPTAKDLEEENKDRNSKMMRSGVTVGDLNPRPEDVSCRGTGLWSRSKLLKHAGGGYATPVGQFEPSHVVEIFPKIKFPNRLFQNNSSYRVSPFPICVIN